MDTLPPYIITVVFVATLVRSTFGFGETMVGLPLLALRIPVETGAPLAVLLSITVALLVILQDHRDIHLGGAARLLAWSVPGIPLGLWILKAGDGRIVKSALAILILSFSAWSLAGLRPPRLREDRGPWLTGCGILAGILGGAYGLNGPPLILYGAMRRWPASQFRATLQAYFLPASILGMASYAVAGLWTADVTHFYVLALPATVAATLLGRALNRRLSGDSFHRYVYIGLLGIGALLLAQAGWG